MNSVTQMQLYDSFTRSLKLFQPIEHNHVKIYSCGPTVYNFAHLGNLRAYIFTDSLRRLLNWKGFDVTHVINITDVGHLTSDADTGEDKLELSAKVGKVTVWEIAEYYTRAFKSDLSKLHVLQPSIWSTATDHIQEMIEFASVLEHNDMTYKLEDGLYFDTASVPDYGALAAGTREPEDSSNSKPLVGRIHQHEDKRQHADFALWRRSEHPGKRLMEWNSPWGVGAPGWHLECSVMSRKYLGAQFDIHTGGIDHREIHHCNEIAQNQGYSQTSQTGANWWMHNNFLVDSKGKMSKSSGEFKTLSWLEAKGITPLVFRFLCLTVHYRKELEFSASTINAALVRLRRLSQAIRESLADTDSSNIQRLLEETRYSRGACFRYQHESLKHHFTDVGRALMSQIDRIMSDDLSLAPAIILVEDVIARRRLSGLELASFIASLDLVFGMGLIGLDPDTLTVQPARSCLAPDDVAQLIAERNIARANRDYSKSDDIRKTLYDASVEVLDRGSGRQWRWLADLDW